MWEETTFSGSGWFIILSELILLSIASLICFDFFLVLQCIFILSKLPYCLKKNNSILRLIVQFPDFGRVTVSTGSSL